MVLKDWRVEPLLNVGETPAMWRTRGLRAKIAGGAFGPQAVPLTFRRRA
jgi:hypothetical protein